MKKIKKLFLLVAFVLLASASMPMISRIAKTATAAPESNFLYLTVEEFNDQVNVGAQYYITPAKIWENNNGVITEQTQESATVKVLNPFGKEVKDSTIASDGYFEVKYPGEYNIVYSYQGYSHALSLNAEEGIYAFEFEKNSQQIIPSYININDYTGKIVLPNPSVKDENGNIIASADVKVTVLNPSMAALNNEQLVKNTDGYYEFNANEAGKWTIKYEYKSANGKVLASTTKTFIANTTYNNDYKLTLTYNSGSKPDTAITNVMKELPTVAGKNAVTNDAVDIYYYITAKKVVYNNAGAVVSEDDVTEQCIANVNEFTPNTDGDYIITYHAKNFFGTTATWEYQISGVKDSQAPEVKVVKPYTTAPAEEYVDASYFLPEKAGLKNIIIPAIWAEDNVNKSLDGLTLTRRIKKTNSNTVIYDSAENPNKALVFEHDSLSHTLDENTEVAVTLAEGVTFGAGTYTVSYIAKDAAGNETTALTFKLVLENGFADNEDPSISWSETQAMPESARVGEKVTFVSPVISDNISSRIQLDVVYQFGDTIDENEWKECEYANGKYEIDVIDADKLFIKATATDAYENSKTINHEVEIHDHNDTLPTQIKQTEEVAGNVYKQQNTITLRDIEYYDDYADYLQVSAFVSVEKDGETITKTAYDFNPNKINYDVDGTLDSVKVSGGKIYASYSGTHKVAYVSKDLKNNYSIMFYSFEIASYTETAEIEFKNPTALPETTLELGESMVMPKAEVSVPDGYKYTYNVSVISGSSNNLINKDTFIPYELGTYVIQYSAYVTDASDSPIADQPEPVTFEVEVVDNTDPVISSIPFAEDEIVPLNYELTVPQFTAIDNGTGINKKTSYVELKNSKNNTTNKWMYDDDTKNRVVTLSDDGIYTLKFVVYDNAGNDTQKTITFHVGDTTPPVITINDSEKDFGTISKDKLSLDLSLVSITENLSKENIIIKVTRDSEIIANIHGDSKTIYEFDAKKAGKYVVTLQIEDGAGNKSETVTREYFVNEKENNGMEKEEIIGTILIVISVVVLAGVIVYFVVSKKKHDKYKG